MATRESVISVTTFICPLKLSPPHLRGNRGQMPDQDQVLPLEDVLSETNPPMVIVLLTEERLVLMAIRPALPDLDLLPWNSEEDSAEARRNKFIMSKLKKRFNKKPPKKKKKKKKKKS